MDVAFDGADHHLAHPRRAGFDQERLQDEHAALHRVGGQEHFGDEQDAIAEIGTDDGHAGHQRLGQRVIGCPAASDQDVDAFLDLFLQPVIEIVVHLQDQLVIGKFGKDDLVVGHGVPRGMSDRCMGDKRRADFALYDMARLKADSKRVSWQMFVECSMVQHGH